MQQAALLGRRQHRDRVGGSSRAQIRAFERIHGDVDFVPLAMAVSFFLSQPHLLTDVQHRRFVALALADDDRAVDRHRVHLAAHRFDGHLVGAMAITLAHRVGAGNGGLFGDAEKL